MLQANGQLLFAHTTLASGSLFAANLLATTDSSPDGANAFGYFNDLRIAADLPAITCPADINADGRVGGPDLTSMLAAWGPCVP